MTERKRRTTPERPQPSSEDAEKGTICSCMLEPAAIGACVERGVTEWWFNYPAHQNIYGALVELWNNGHPTDFISVTNALREMGLLDSVGGAPYITTLFTYLPTAANLTHYLDIIESKHIQRSVIKVGTEYASRAYDETEDAVQLLDEFETKAMAIRKIRKARRNKVDELVFEVIDDFQKAYENPGVISGITTGYPDIDAMIDGMQPEQMIVIAARPGNGKTALSMGIVEHLVFDLKLPVAVFSLEMSAKQLVHRLLCSMARVDWRAFRDGFHKESDFPRITHAANKIKEAAKLLHIDDAAGQSIQEIRAKARRLKAEFGIAAGVIDYLQLATSNTKKASENRQIEVAEVSTGCKHCAKELGIPLIVLAQIDRKVDKEKRKPRLADLRESGSIEQDADLVAFIQREDLLTDNEEEQEACGGRAVFSIAKQRNGPLGDVPLTFLKEFSRFESRSRAQEEPELIPAEPRRQSRPHRRTKQEE